MRRALLGCLGLVCLTAALSSPAWSVERELAGVRLGAKAVTLLSRAGFGQPGFIGPLGVVGNQVVASTAARSGPAGAAGATRAGGQGARGGQGMRGGGGGMGGMRGGGMGGMRGGGMRGALTPGTGLAGSVGGPSRFGVELTQMRGGGMGGGMRGGMGGGMRGGGGGGQGMRGGGGGRATGAAPTARAGAGQPSTLYWLYRRTAGTTLVLSINLKGIVTAITLTGGAPYAAGRTSLGVGLATSYGDVIRRYGFPDQSTANGTVLDVTYVDAGVRFRLDSMRVTQITVGGIVAAAAAPSAAPAAPSAPTPGLSVDELKSYM